MRLPSFAFAVSSVVFLAACASVNEAPSAVASDAAVAAPASDAAGDVDVAASFVGSKDGAAFRIDRPAGWNGVLIMYAHGFEMPGAERPAEIAQDAFGEWALSNGYALARSGYSTTGWAVAEAVPDTEKLRQLAIESLGPPERTYLIGHSLGGHIVLASLEAHPNAYDGALALCGVNAPAAETFADGVVAPLVATELLVPAALGLAAGGLADPASPPMLDPQVLEAALAADERDAQRIADRFEMPREGLGPGLWLRYVALRDVIARTGGFPVDNRTTKYTGLGDDAAFNAQVRRYRGDPEAMAYLAAHAPLRGSAPKPVVVLSNIVDPSVPPSISARYAGLARTAGRSDHVLTLPSTGEGHCAFDDAAVGNAFDVLSRWVESGVRPSP